MSLSDAWCGPVPSADRAVARLPVFGGVDRVELANRDGAIRDEVTALFDAHRAPLLRYLLSMGLNVSDSEDLVQETFLALFRHLQRDRPRTNLRGWIFRTGHNLGLKRRSMTGRTRRRTVSTQCTEPLADKAPNPEQRLCMIERYERMNAVLQALPQRDRCCLSLRAEGLRYREIAQVLGVSLGTVSNSMRRAALRLRNVRA